MQYSPQARDILSYLHMTYLYSFIVSAPIPRATRKLIVDFTNGYPSIFSYPSPLLRNEPLTAQQLRFLYSYTREKSQMFMRVSMSSIAAHQLRRCPLSPVLGYFSKCHRALAALNDELGHLHSSKNTFAL